MSHNGGSSPYDYIPAENWRSLQRDDFESIHGRPSQYNWNRMQPGFPRYSVEERTNRYNQNRMHARLPHYTLEEPTPFQSENPAFSHPRWPNPRRSMGGPIGFNSIPTGHRSRGPPQQIRVLVFEDNLEANAWQAQFPQLDPPPHSPPRFQGFMQTQDNPQSSRDESKLTRDEQGKVLSKLKKEIYNPTTHLYFRDKNRATPEISKEKDENWKRCSICLEDFEPREIVTHTPCKHMFHEECIVPWVKNTGLCPVCRSAICERLNDNSAPPHPRRRLPPPPPPLDSDTLAMMRAIMLDDEYELHNRMPVLIGR